MFFTLVVIGFAVVFVRLLGASSRAQIALIVAGLGLVLGLQLSLPQGHPAQMATGGALNSWLILVGIAAAVGVYVNMLGRLKARAHGTANTSQTGKANATELERYARHIILREIGGPGQKKLRNAKVLVIGAGGLGAPVLQYLAAAGVGTIGVIDDDIVSLSNLQRQVLFEDNQIDEPKVFAAQHRLQRQNPYVTIKPYNRRLTETLATELFPEYDVILDGTDLFSTRFMVNAVSVITKKPLISGAITQWEGQISVFDPANGHPCYACLFDQEPADGLAPSCAEAGVVGALPGVIGSMMAIEAIKWITGAGVGLQGELLIYDALYGESRKIKIERRPNCGVCGS